MRAYQDAKEEFSNAVGWLAKKPSSPLTQAAVIIDYYFKQNRRRDADNYSGKIVHDALVDNGVIKDDSYSTIISMPFFHNDKSNPRTEITVIEKKDINVIRAKIREVLHEL